MMTIVDPILNKNLSSHIGWNNLRFDFGQDLFEGISNQPSFYFTHSHYVCTYNINGMEFHFKKSSSNGLKSLKTLEV